MQSAGICSAAILIFTWAVFCGIKELLEGKKNIRDLGDRIYPANRGK